MKPKKFRTQWLYALESMRHKKYWNKANTVEFFAFMTKAFIIIPGLLFSVQIWWLYIFALVTSLALIWSSTVKTLIFFGGSYLDRKLNAVANLFTIAVSTINRVLLWFDFVCVEYYQ